MRAIDEYRGKCPKCGGDVLFCAGEPVKHKCRPREKVMNKDTREEAWRILNDAKNIGLFLGEHDYADPTARVIELLDTAGLLHKIPTVEEFALEYGFDAECNDNDKEWKVYRFVTGEE